MTRKNASLDTEPNMLKRLMTGPVLLAATRHDLQSSRQFAAAQLKPGIILRLRLAVIEDVGDGEEWDAYRKTLHLGKVVCPMCEQTGGGDDCEMCKGNGMVPRNVWDQWYFDTKSCRDFKKGCEEECCALRCPHDATRASVSNLILMLDASTTTSVKWKPYGNSMDGWKLVGLCAHPFALERYLNLVADSVNALSFDDGEEEE